MGSYRFRSSRPGLKAAVFTGCTLLACALQGGVVEMAHAQGKPSTKLTDAQKKDQAKKLFSDANAAYDKGEFDRAYQLFNEADGLVPGAVPKFRAAEALDKAGKVEGAISAYESFLSSNPPPDKNQERIDSAKKRIEALKSQPAEITITLTPADAAGATILVDGAKQTGTTFRVPPGKHVITVKAPGFEDATIEQAFTFAEKREIPVELKKGSAATPPPAVAPPVPPPTTPPPDEPAEGGSSKIPAYITLGLAGAGFIVGTIFGISALSSNSDYEENPTQEAFDTTERNALIADMAFGASIAFGVTGVVLLLTADDGESTPAATKVLPKRRARNGDFVAPYVTPNGAGAAARVSF